MTIWDETTTQLRTTELHDAARFDDVVKVQKLIEDREIIIVNKHGYSPLHFAAMAINPNAEIAKLLIDSVNGSQSFLDKQTCDKRGQNTALHIAAGNVNVTEEFIQQFKEADSPLLCNSKGDTPFHVAAKSRNPNAIIYMLNTFAPTNNRWDVDKVDERQKYPNTVINICARNSNAKAVALLIKHGADISKGVLHEIVLESVRNPDKIKDLAGVYQSIVDNAVTWRGLEKEPAFLKVKGSDDYTELHRKIMIWLLTNPIKNYDGKDVLQFALDHGAAKMFLKIINTEFVFRMHGEEAGKFVDKQTNKQINEGGVENMSDGKRCTQSSRKNYNWTVFDITNFTKETCLNMSEPASVTRISEGTALISRCCQDGQNDEDQRKSERSTKRDFDKPSAPNVPYLTHLLMTFNQWKKTNILSTQPLKELTMSYITLVQRFYLILGLLQLIFMIMFTVYCMPTSCSLALKFNASTTGCSGHSTHNSEYAVPSSISQQRSWIAVLWLIWPIILMTENELVTFHFITHAREAYKYLSNNVVLKSKNSRFALLGKILRRTVALRVFCIMAFVWLYLYFWSESHESYVGVTAMVLLFGWITNLEFFGAVSKNFSISMLVVEKIIKKDIPSFMLFFGFSVVGFSLALHTIRMSACMENQIIDLHDTFFAVLSSAFGIGDFFEDTISHPICAGGGMQRMFEIVYLGYVCATMIVLLNILIAMMNNRYEKAKRRAENIFRFQMLSMMTVLQHHEYLVKVLKKCFVKNFGPNLNDKRKRYYLQLLLPVDEKLEQ